MCKAVNDTLLGFVYTSTEAEECAIPFTLLGGVCEHYTIEKRWKFVSTSARLPSTCSIGTTRPPRKRQRTSDQDLAPTASPPLIHNNGVQNGTAFKSQYHNIPMVRPPSASRASRLATLPNECRQLISLFSWNDTAVGSFESWPVRLFEMFLLVIIDPRPASVIWGAESIMLFNEGYREFLEEEKSKSEMGMPLATAVRELFDVARQIFGEVRDLGHQRS